MKAGYQQQELEYRLKRKLFLEKIEYIDGDIKLFINNDGELLLFSFTSIFSFRIIDEGNFLKALDEQGNKLTIGMYTSNDSSYLSWFHEQSYNMHLESNLLEYIILTQNEVIQVIGVAGPEVKVLA